MIAIAVGCDQTSVHQTPGAGEKEIAIGEVGARLLELKAEYGSELDDIIVDFVRVQCAGTTLPAGLEINAASIGRFFPMEYASQAVVAWCGKLVLKGGRDVNGPAFGHPGK